ncbi:CBL-interacting serine/threonine-protein kinase 14-like [Neltuma alba]|uniref:CBL-interacting serine/threonine-protein kinase 14-like n=1 Tax=Neltuma alba TaxID=207710 RepID=UPI0010A45EFA|nr:CBL-interacting serine/threonine-protein kinase 14-like [Prosopis alba]
MFQAIREINRNIGEEERVESTSPTREEEPEGVLFGKYEIGRFLGVGGFAKVYEAFDVVTKQSVAIKVVSKRRIAEARLTAQVQREIAIMHRLNHPNIVKLYEVLATKTKIYFVMECAHGGELYDRILNHGLFDEDHSRRCFQQLISAVQHCHSRGVFHRDLKLDNLLLDQDLNLKVSDFGLSATTDQIRPDGMLHTLCGTPAYLTPEMLAKKGYDGEKVDVWQCGVVLYVLTVGSLPFNESNVPTLLRRIYRGQVRIPRCVKPDLKRLIKRMLDPNPKTRISIDEILEDPWFRKGYREIKVQQKNPEWEDEDRTKSLNAFHLISFSSGLDMSGLLITDPEPEVSGSVERIVSKETPKSIVEMVESVADRDIVTVIRKQDGWGAKIEGHSGNFVILIGVYRLTDELVVIEVKKKEKDEESGAEFWEEKLRPRILELEYKPE